MPLVLAEAYLHTLNPFVVEFSPGLGIRWYGLSYAVGFLLAWAVLRWVASRGWSPLRPHMVGDLVFAVVVGVLVGGRVGYALFYERHLFVQFGQGFPWWGVLGIHRGGMSSHGGMIGVLIAITWFARRHRLPAAHLLDIAALGSTPGLFFGRIANFINAELWGKALPAASQSSPPWWSVKYPTEVVERWLPLAEPAAANDPARAELVAVVAHDLHLTAPRTEWGEIVVREVQSRLGSVEHALMPALGSDDRFFERVVRIASDAGAGLHQEVAQALKPLLTAYYPSQLFQAATDGPILAILLCAIWSAPRKPGMVASCWLIGYGVLRILTEVFRQPDEGVSLILGLQRGQLLSVLMILAGAACLVILARRDAPKLGGLFASRAEAAMATP